jgi:hypothetical protein
MNIFIVLNAWVNYNTIKPTEISSVINVEDEKKKKERK